MSGGAIEFPLRGGLLLGVLAAQRVFELWLSSRHLRRLPAPSSLENRGAPRAAGTLGDWCAMIAVHAGLIVLPAIEVLYMTARTSTAFYWTGVGAYGLAQALRYWSIASLGSSWNARAVVDARQDCVTNGPYRWIRHPNYLAVLIDFSAVPLALGAWRSWIVLNLVHAPILLRRIRAEERLLAEIPGYTEQMHSKGRLVPRLGRAASRRA